MTTGRFKTEPNIQNIPIRTTLGKEVRKAFTSRPSIKVDKLFVDVDDTLLLFDKSGPNPYGYYYGTPYTINEALVQGIRDFRTEYPKALIIVWSGGGSDYAKEVGTLLGLDSVVSRYESKEPSTLGLIDSDSIVVDDMKNLDILCKRTHDPFSWPIKHA